MQEPRAQRTLVKSPPELWAEVSDVDALARHLGEFGEIRITRLEPETTVAWEGDRACGTVALEPSGWGTKVTLTAKLAEVPEPEAPEAELVAGAEAEPAAEPEAIAPEAEPVAGAEAEPAAEPEAIEPEPEPEPEAAEPEPLAPEPAAAEPGPPSPSLPSPSLPGRSPRPTPSATLRSPRRPRHRRWASSPACSGAGARWRPLWRPSRSRRSRTPSPR